MTQYHGGKHRNGKKIAEILNSELKLNRSGYCEPFHGMLGVYRHITYKNRLSPEALRSSPDKPDLTYLAGDTNKSVMLMWQKAQNGWVPPSDIVTKEEFLRLKFDGESTAEKGFIGTTHAYAGLYFRCYCLTEGSKKAIPNVAKRVSDIALNSVVSKVKFSYGDYTQFSDLRNFLIYCDPPYENTIGYRNDQNKSNFSYDKFDNLAFWNWTKQMAEYNTVFVSEFNPPPPGLNYEIVLGYNYNDNNSEKKKDLLFKILK